ncbi:hypothetical protein BC939DRAFT_447623 [Gamsiella multidivaricata]|uniref:uncharacterized protein n=1 Tax=Gamsiella multidivaricata TaxID=101098 RepID=UPI00221F157B|nr:uncharacterized protein BC939DRAFT_447623 [Gamsiella multidivaricata]KAI7826049.1 hypothetical protein BC939DRAFT_447623 [Gamsiella multidivaricata]
MKLPSATIAVQCFEASEASVRLRCLIDIRFILDATAYPLASYTAILPRMTLSKKH